MSATSRAEARRRAILSKGTDRLARLTTSARGEETSSQMHDDPKELALPGVQKNLEDFVGDEGSLPTWPIPEYPSPSPRKSPTMPVGRLSAPSSWLQKWMPLIHLLATWCLLGYFVLHLEPRMQRNSGENTGDPEVWRRWAMLGQTRAIGDLAKLLKFQVVPLFWAFTSFQIISHSIRLVCEFDVVQPPRVLAALLPHLPPPLPDTVIHILKHSHLMSLFLNDLSGLVVGLGFIVMFSGWLLNSS